MCIRDSTRGASGEDSFPSVLGCTISGSSVLSGDVGRGSALGAQPPTANRRQRDNKIASFFRIVCSFLNSLPGYPTGQEIVYRPERMVSTGFFFLQKGKAHGIITKI